VQADDSVVIVNRPESWPPAASPDRHQQQQQQQQVQRNSAGYGGVSDWRGGGRGYRGRGRGGGAYVMLPRVPLRHPQLQRASGRCVMSRDTRLQVARHSQAQRESGEQ
jgi:hypothetical protein